VGRLHDDAQHGDRWRVRVRGEVGAGADREASLIWLRVTPEDYQRAIRAHLGRRTVRAQGHKVRSGRRTEIVPGSGGLEVLP